MDPSTRRSPRRPPSQASRSSRNSNPSSRPRPQRSMRNNNNNNARNSNRELNTMSNPSSSRQPSRSSNNQRNSNPSSRPTPNSTQRRGGPNNSALTDRSSRRNEISNRNNNSRPRPPPMPVANSNRNPSSTTSAINGKRSPATNEKETSTLDIVGGVVAGLLLFVLILGVGWYIFKRYKRNKAGGSRQQGQSEPEQTNTHPAITITNEPEMTENSNNGNNNSSNAFPLHDGMFSSPPPVTREKTLSIAQSIDNYYYSPSAATPPKTVQNLQFAELSNSHDDNSLYRLSPLQNQPVIYPPPATKQKLDRSNTTRNHGEELLDVFRGNFSEPSNECALSSSKDSQSSLQQNSHHPSPRDLYPIPVSSMLHVPYNRDTTLSSTTVSSDTCTPSNTFPSHYDRTFSQHESMRESLFSRRDSGATKSTRYFLDEPFDLMKLQAEAGFKMDEYDSRNRVNTVSTYQEEDLEVTWVDSSLVNNYWDEFVSKNGGCERVL